MYRNFCRHVIIVSLPKDVQFCIKILVKLYFPSHTELGSELYSINGLVMSQ